MDLDFSIDWFISCGLYTGFGFLQFGILIKKVIKNVYFIILGIKTKNIT
jgi:hypothetical protein